MENLSKNLKGDGEMELDFWGTLFGICGTVCAILFGYAAFHRNAETEVQENGKESGTLLTEIGYIKSGVDDIKRKQDKQEEQYISVTERMATVESSAKQAHKRLDRLENITDHKHGAKPPHRE